MTQTNTIPDLAIAVEDGAMLPFTTLHFRRLRDALTAGGWSEAGEQQELRAGGPTFVKGPGRITLDSVVVFGFVYWRVRRWNAETSAKNSRHPAMKAL